MTSLSAMNVYTTSSFRTSSGRTWSQIRVTSAAGPKASRLPPLRTACSRRCVRRSTPFTPTQCMSLATRRKKGATWFRPLRFMTRLRGCSVASSSDDFQQAVVDSISDSTSIVCDVSPYRLSDDEVLSMSWKDFVTHIKHRSRYFFSTPVEVDPIDDETIQPATFLNSLSRMISDLELFRETEEAWFRARVHKAGEDVASGASLGTPPEARILEQNESCRDLHVLWSLGTRNGR